MTVRKDYRLTFITDKNERLLITVPRADDTLPDAEVSTAMTGIIDSDVVMSTAGAPREKHAAELRRIEVTEFDLAV
jgi:hypothetical protein